jgi:hypothetical protein
VPARWSVNSLRGTTLVSSVQSAVMCCEVKDTEFFIFLLVNLVTCKWPR